MESGKSGSERGCFCGSCAGGGRSIHSENIPVIGGVRCKFYARGGKSRGRTCRFTRVCLVCRGGGACSFASRGGGVCRNGLVHNGRHLHGA